MALRLRRSELDRSLDHRMPSRERDDILRHGERAPIGATLERKVLAIGRGRAELRHSGRTDGTTNH